MGGQCERKNNVDLSGLQALFQTLSGALSSIPEAGQYLQMGFGAAASGMSIFEKMINKPKKTSIKFTVTSKHQGYLKDHNAPTLLQTENKGFEHALPMGDVQLLAKGPNINVTMAVGPDGKAVIVSDNPGSKTSTVGALKDTPFAGNGNLVQTHLDRRSKRKGAVTKCADVQLRESHNPIPRKVTEAYKQVGNCIRPAVMLFSPAVARFFRRLPPALAFALKRGMLGID